MNLFKTLDCLFGGRPGDARRDLIIEGIEIRADRYANSVPNMESYEIDWDQQKVFVTCRYRDNVWIHERTIVPGLFTIHPDHWKE